MQKIPAKKIALGRVLRYAMASVFAIGVALLTATGFFISKTLEHITVPVRNTPGPGTKMERVDEALLDRMSQAVETRTSADREITGTVHNPFIVGAPVPEVPVEGEQPATTQ